VNAQASELHRRACEARHYLRMPGAERVAALQRIAAKRGQKAAERLAEDIRAVRDGKSINQGEAA
jgi:hypothetical protein